MPAPVDRTDKLSNAEVAGRRVAVAVIRNATSINTELEQARDRAERDPLTGLGNRLHLSKSIGGALAEPNGAFSVLFLDLDAFKKLNDDHGHEFGDKVLRIVAKRLKSGTRGIDVVARLGGDEFALLLKGVADAKGLARIAAKLARAIARPFHVAGAIGTVGVSIGGAIAPRDGRSEAQLLRRADAAMYKAKRERLRYCIYGESGQEFQRKGAKRKEWK